MTFYLFEDFFVDVSIFKVRPHSKDIIFMLYTSSIKNPGDREREFVQNLSSDICFKS